MLLIVGLASCRLDVGVHLSFKRLGKPLSSSAASDFVEVELELFAGSRPGASFSSVCTSADVGAPAPSIYSPERKLPYTFRETFDPRLPRR